MKLPEPLINGDTSLEKAIKMRRTIRSFKTTSLSFEQLSQVLWAGQGITAKRGFYRSAPSAGALYPMDLYAIVGTKTVSALDAGVYHYLSRDHDFSLIKVGDLREKLARSSLSQMWMAMAPVNLVITAEYGRVTVKYGERGFRYAMIEAGHIGQNIFLQAVVLGLSAGIVGAFNDKDVISVLGLPRTHEPLIIMPVGYGA